MSWAVNAIINMRDRATMDAAKLDTTKIRLQSAAHLVRHNRSISIRGKIVATKEGGAIDRRRAVAPEYLGDLYGDVSQYEGRPSRSSLARADVMGRQLEEVSRRIQQICREPTAPASTSRPGAKPCRAHRYIVRAGLAEGQSAETEVGPERCRRNALAPPGQ